MRILRRSRHHLALTFLPLLSVPVFLLNIWVMQKGATAKLLEAEKLRWIGAELLWALLVVRLLYRARWSGFWLFLSLSVAVLVGNLYFLLVTKNYALAFYALFLLILSGVYLMNLYQSLSEAYYHSGRRWYEGLPRFIPRLEAELETEKGPLAAKLSRLDTGGCYSYADNGRDIGDVRQVVLKLGDLKLGCAVELMSKTQDGLGGGLRFVVKSEDQRKDIRDFIDRVRSSGYVS